MILHFNPDPIDTHASSYQRPGHMTQRCMLTSAVSEMSEMSEMSEYRMR